jgi:hypothetical protein
MKLDAHQASLPLADISSMFALMAEKKGIFGAFPA